MRTGRRAVDPGTIIGALLALALIGCAAKPGPKEHLAEGYKALQEKRLDEATAAADKVLGTDGTGRGSAEALYLKGRVAEEKAQSARDPAQAKQFLEQARRAYERALATAPPAALDGAIRAQLSNVAYFREDYLGAVREGTAALKQIPKVADKAWVLYRIGLSQQRLGQFAEADQTFAQVIQSHAGTEPARRATLHRGARAFHVQVGTFANGANADRTVKSLRADGFAAVRSVDPASRNVIIGVGPVATYQQAKMLQAQLAPRYRDTLIIP